MRCSLPRDLLLYIVGLVDPSEYRTLRETCRLFLRALPAYQHEQVRLRAWRCVVGTHRRSVVYKQVTASVYASNYSTLEDITRTARATWPVLPFARMTTVPTDAHNSILPAHKDDPLLWLRRQGAHEVCCIPLMTEPETVKALLCGGGSAMVQG